jgi:tripartite-type tricarboxylate transporter receptor subunit TctC
MMRRRQIALAALAIIAAAGPTLAQSYPTRPIRMVVPFAPGGATDIVARLIGEQLSRQLGQPVVVENRAGAGGTVGSDIVAKAPADGYVLVVSNIAAHGAGPAITRNMPYDADRDFTHIALIGTIANALVVNPNLPARMLEEFMAHARRNPGLFYGSGGRGTSAHLSGELLRAMTGLDIVHVPYRGAAPAMADLIGGQIPAVFDAIGSIAPAVRAGQLRMLAVTSPQRSPAMPDVPTMAEAGVPGYEATSWFGFSGPAGLPPPVVERLSQGLRRAMEEPAVTQRLAALGFVRRDYSPAEYQSFVRAELAKWADVVRRAGIQPE